MHPNVGPFIGKQLIQRLVTSNPTPQYVARVAAAFANNGQGVRGDMKAVIKAVLMDPDARTGSHHFVIGGAVKGRDIYGNFPATGLGHDQDVGSGSLLPTLSVDQYGATLASWFGLSATQINDVCPNIANFSKRNIGFMI